jgi:hypothetical protein
VCLAIRCQQVVYQDAIKNTLFRRIVTTYLRILALSLLLCLRRQASSSSTRGPWRSVLYLSSIVVSILAFFCPLVPWLISSSHDNLHVLQTPTPVQRDNVVFPRSQQWSVPPANGPFCHRDIWDHSVGDVFYRVLCEGGCQTLGRLGRHAPPLFRGHPGPKHRLEE